jgi:hypothetical protein
MRLEEKRLIDVAGLVLDISEHNKVKTKDGQYKENLKILIKDATASV